MDDFLAAVDTRQSAKIIIDGESVFVTRRRLLAHLQLSKIDVEIKSGQPVEMAGRVIEYLSLAGLKDEQIKDASVYELLEAFFSLRRLNSWQWLLPWLEQPNTTPSSTEIYEYSGRRWAIWIHKLSSRYGWAPDVIWQLYPEETAAYMQEIMLSEYYEREDKRALSEVSYKYDASTKTSKFMPSPMYSWMVDEALPKSVRTLVSVLPVGNVVKLEDD